MTTTNKYVVRSMTTTDFDVVRGIQAEPYHIYLMPPHKRVGAYWASIFHAQLFDTPQEAEAEIARSLHGLYPHQPDTDSQVVPVDDSKMPAYWELRDAR